MTPIIPESILHYLQDNTKQFALAVCATLHDMVGISYTPSAGEVELVQAERHVQAYTVFLPYFGIVTGDYIITLDESSARALSAKIIPSIDDREKRLTFGSLLKEALNIAAAKPLHHLQDAIGTLTASTPTFVYGELDLPKIAAGKCRIEANGDSIECLCSINLANYEVATLLKNALGKLDRVTASQTAMLVQPMQIPNARFSVVYKSLQEAGGDLYDVIPLDNDSFGYFIGDVSGHDIGKGFTTASLKALLRQNLHLTIDPARSLAQVNNVLCTIMKNNEYITASYVVLNRKKGTLQVFNLGHPPLMMVPLAGKVQLIKGAKNTFLGIFENLVFHSVEINVNAGDRFILFTDGLIESNKTWTAALGDLRHQVESVGQLPVEDVAKELYNKLFPPPMKPTDDVTVIAVEV